MFKQRMTWFTIQARIEATKAAIMAIREAETPANTT